MGDDTPRLRRHHRVLRVIGGVSPSLLVLVVIAGGVGVWTITRSFPQTSGIGRRPRPDAPVTVYRDDAGIPQLEASTADDLFRAQGYRARAGPLLGDGLPPSRHRRPALRDVRREPGADGHVHPHPRLARGRRAGGEAARPTSLRYYQDYADGVNAYLKKHSGAELSLEYAVLGLQNPGYRPEPWTPADSVAWLKAMAWDLRSNLEDEIDRALLATKLKPEQVAAAAPGVSVRPAPDDHRPGRRRSPRDERRRTRSLGRRSRSVRGRRHPPRPRRPAAVRVARSSSSRRALDALPTADGAGRATTSAPTPGSSPAPTPPAASPCSPTTRTSAPRCRRSGTRSDCTAGRSTPACPFDVAGFSFSGLPGHHHRPQRPHRVGLHQPRARRRRPLRREGHRRHLRVRRQAGPADDPQGDDPASPAASRRDDHRALDAARADRHRHRATAYAVIAKDQAGKLERPGRRSSSCPSQWTALTPGPTPDAIFAFDTRDATGRASARPPRSVPGAVAEPRLRRRGRQHRLPGARPRSRSARRGDGTVPVPGWTSRVRVDGLRSRSTQLPSVLQPAERLHRHRQQRRRRARTTRR